MRKESHHTEQTRKILSQKTKAAYKDGRLVSVFRNLTPEVREKIAAKKRGIPPWNKGKPSSTKERERLRNLRRGLPPSNKGKPFRHSGSFIKGHSDISKNKGRVRTKQQREVTAEITKAMWQDPEFVAKQMKGRNTKPNNQELLFDSWLQRNFPGEWKYIGDGRDKAFIIGGKCPDWGHANSQKKLIELFGDYWHRGENPQEKIDHYKQCGYHCLVIWEHELKDEKVVIDKVRNF